MNSLHMYSMTLYVLECNTDRVDVSGVAGDGLTHGDDTGGGIDLEVGWGGIVSDDRVLEYVEGILKQKIVIYTLNAPYSTFQTEHLINLLRKFIRNFRFYFSEHLSKSAN